MTNVRTDNLEEDIERDAKHAKSNNRTRERKDDSTNAFIVRAHLPIIKSCASPFAIDARIPISIARFVFPSHDM